MKLFYSPASPFVRKVLVLASERGLRNQITLVDCAVSPIAIDPSVRAHNPTGKIPTLLLGDGTALYDSRVIVDYLDTLPGGPSLLPVSGPGRLQALVTQSLADEMIDAAVLMRYETFLRPEALRWPEWIEGQRTKIRASLDVLEQGAERLAQTFDLGAIAAACAIGYLELRFPEEPWRASRPRLSGWYQEILTRPSLAQTMPR